MSATPAGSLAIWPPGVVRAGYSAQGRSCGVFLMDVVGRPANEQVRGRLSGWSQQLTQSRAYAYTRRLPSGNLMVMNIHYGPDNVLPGQIGALLRVYILK